MASLLEPEFAPHFDAWKKAKTPEANATMLGHIQPMIDQAITAHVGQANPLLTSRARKMALDALKTYDPSRARLRTHLFNQLQGLKRVNRQQTSVIRVPERVSLDRYHLDNATQELIDKLGRDPTDDELADHAGFSVKRIKHVRGYNPAVAEGTLEAAHPEGQQVFGGTEGLGPRHSLWHEVVKMDLSPTDQYIMEATLKGVPNQVVARKLKRSPGLVSQRKKFIQGLLDQEDRMTDF